jgi:Protein of unknown function (DUF3617)
MRFSFRAVAIIVLGSLVVAFGQTVNLHPGKYEITMDMSVAGMTKITPPKSEVCITSEDVKNIASGKKLSGPEQLGLNCKTSNFTVNGNSATFSMTCDTGTFAAETKFDGDSYVQTLSGKDKDGHAISGTAKAKRIGECTK